MPKKSSQKIPAFSNGSEFEDWHLLNCDRCKLFNEDINKTCAIERKLVMAYLSDGLVTQKTFDTILGNNGNCKKMVCENE